MRVPRPRRRPGDPRFAVALTVAGWAVVSAAVVALVVRQVPASWQPLIVLASFAHWPLVLAPAGVALFVLARRWRATAAAAVCALLAITTQAPLYVASARAPDGARLGVLQANLGFGRADPDAVVRLVARHDVALLATEELTVAARERLLAKGLGRLLPYRFDAALPSGGGGLAIWSRYPLSAEVNVEHFELGVLTARVALPDGSPLTFVAVHLLPPYPYPAAEWLAETDRLRNLLHAQDGRVIVAGDFNATSDHVRFRRLLTDGYRDGADQVGAGYLTTYPTDRWFPPLVAIDHVLAKGTVVTRLSARRLRGSDHRALLARVAVG